MPLVKCFGIPDYTSDAHRRKFKDAVKKTIASIKEMELTINQVSVMLFSEVGGGESEIQIEITFNKKPKRTKEIRTLLAQKVLDVTKEHFPGTKLIECWGIPFEKNNGFAASC